MKDQESIPTSKLERTAHFVSTGVKIGGNYVKHYTQRLLNQDVTKEDLHKDNADDIYETLSHLKGSALKVAQMLSMDRGLLPKSYQDKFQLSQYSAPPLSGPLVTNTFIKSFGKIPSQIFDSFEIVASNAASIGQVHKATKNGKKLAIKIQYPGVANSITSDLRMVKPIAVRLVGLSTRDADKYFEEVETKLLEETDYQLELRRSIELSTACKHIENLHFPTYYPEFSSNRIITMDWLDGMHMVDFLATNPSKETRNKVGQALWDFYDFQVHTLKQVHADPHPGNFLFKEDGTVNIFDFGCIKVIPQDFYKAYFTLIDQSIYKDEAKVKQIYEELEMIHAEDSQKEIDFFFPLFKKMIDMLTLPFTVNEFDFGDDSYFGGIYQFTEDLSNMKEIKESKKARGSRHSLYINRTYYGLYHILFDLKSVVQTSKKLELV
ncbi:MAG: AarF/ABC1/UbiB kinase family protein [Cytophagales bacterium]|nr:MAG: AarF/ABC1/UbiB kinase family protein [Cytophagales bacterium]